MPYLGTRISTPIHHAPDRDPAPSLAGMSIATDRPSSTSTTGSLTKDVISPPPRLSEDQKDEFWRKTRVWADTPAKDFMSYRWSVSSSGE
jgi:lysine 2,3-aminomutase